MLMDTTKHTQVQLTAPDVHVMLMQAGPWNNINNLTLSRILAKKSHFAEAHYRLKWMQKIKGAPQQVNFLN